MSNIKPYTKQQLQNDLQEQLFDEDKIIYSIAKKQNKSGLWDNQRFLLLDYLSQEFGFTNLNKQLKPSPFIKKENIPKLKKKAKVTDLILKQQVKKNQLSLQMSVKLMQNNKAVFEDWTFIFKQKKLKIQWKKKIQQLQRKIKDQLNNLKNLEKQIPPPNQDLQISPITKNQEKKIVNQNPQQPMQLEKLLDQSKSQKFPSNINDVSKHQNQLLQNTSKLNQQNKQLNDKKQQLKIDSRKIQGSKIIKDSNINASQNLINPPVKQQNYQYNKQLNIKKQQSKILNKSGYNKQDSKINVNILDSNINDSNINPDKFQKSQQSIIQNSNSKVLNIESKFNKNKTVSDNLNNSNQSGQPVQKIFPSQSKIINSQNSLIASKVNITNSQIIQSDWNYAFYNSQNEIQILTRYKKQCERVVIQIIDDLINMKQNKKFFPIKQSESEQVYIVQNLIVKLAFIVQDENSQKLLKNQFRNYNYILQCTKNKQKIRVPLSCIVQYKGIVCLVKSKVLSDQIVSAKIIQKQLRELEQLTKIKKQVFQNQQNGMFKKVMYKNIGIIYVDQLLGFLPFDHSFKGEHNQYISDFLEINDSLTLGGYLDEGTLKKESVKENLLELSETMKRFSVDFLYYLQNLDIEILNAQQFYKQLHINGINTRYLGIMYKKAKVGFIKKYLISEMCARVARIFIRKTLQQNIRNISLKININSNRQAELLESIYFFINDILSLNELSSKIWRGIAKEVVDKYQVSLKKQQLCIGYFLSSLFKKMNLNVNFKYFSKEKEYLMVANTISKEFITGFSKTTQCYDIKFTELGSQLEKILNQPTNINGFQNLLRLLNLESQGIPQFCKIFGYDERIRIFLSPFLTKTNHQHQFSHLNLYSIIQDLPPTAQTITLALLRFEQAIKNKQNKIMLDIFNTSIASIQFWGGQNHIFISKFYCAYAKYYSSIGDYTSAINLIKNSLVTIIKLIGANNNHASQKYYLLADLYCKLENRDEALSNLIKAKQNIKKNSNNDQDAQTAQMQGNIQLKLGVIYLNSNKLNEAKNNVIDSIKIFQNLPEKQILLIESYQLLSRIYQVNQSKNDMILLSNKIIKKFSQTQNINILTRSMKICLYPHLNTLTLLASKQLVNLLQKMNINENQNNNRKSFQFLHKKFLNENIMEIFVNKLNKIEAICGQISQKNILRSYNGFLSSKNTQIEQFLSLLEAFAYLVSKNYIIGVLEESQF